MNAVLFGEREPTLPKAQNPDNLPQDKTKKMISPSLPLRQATPLWAGTELKLKPSPTPN